MDVRSKTMAAAHGTRSEGVFIIGPRGIIEDVDDAGCTLLGYARSELVGLHGSEVVPPEARPATAASIDRMRRAEIARREGRLRRKDGTLLRVDVHAQPLPDGRLSLRVRPIDPRPRPGTDGETVARGMK